MSFLMMSSAGSVSSPGGGESPDFSPFFLWAGNEGSNGNLASDAWFDFFEDGIVYRTASGVEPAAGPFGETIIGEMTTHEYPGSQYWGGIIDLEPADIRQGDHLYLSFWTYYASNFCFGYGSSGESGERIKFIRISSQTATNDRLNIEIGDFNQSCGSTANVRADVSELDGQFYPFPDGGDFSFGRSQWHHTSFHIYVHSSEGWIRGWLDDNYIGQTEDHPTIRNGSTILYGLRYFDYWNGGHLADSFAWTSNWILSTEEPNFTDSGGRPYLPASLKVADFG